MAQAARGRPRLRGDGRPRGDLPQPRSSGPTSSTSRCSAPRRSTSPRSKIEELPRRSPRSGASTVDDADKAHARRTRRSSRSTRRTTRRSSSSRSSTPPASRWEPLVELYLARLETREETSEQDRAPPQDRPRLRGEARRQEPGARRARQRARRWTSTTARRLATSSAWRRPRAAGPRSSRPSNAGSSSRRSRSRRSASACTSPSGTATTSATPSTRSPTTRRSSQLDPNNVGALRQMASLYQEERRTGSSWARRSRARSTSRSTTSIARRS